MAGSVLVCLHGLGRTPSDWDGVRVALEQFGRVVTPQLPRDAERAYRVAAESTPNAAVLVGHSFGAILAMRLAAEPGSSARGVVASSSFFPPALNGRSFAAAIADYGAHRLAFVRGLCAPDRLPGSGRMAASGLRLLLRSAGPGSQFRATAASITAPVLVVHAVDDHYVPLDFVLAAAARRPSWDVAVLDSGGHYPHVRQPTQWLAVLDPWLRRLDPHSD